MRTREEILRKGRFSSIPDAVLADPDVGPTAKLVYIALARHLRNGNREVWPSIPRLADLTGLGDRTVSRALIALEAAALIVGKRSAGRSTRYGFNDPEDLETDANPCQPDRGNPCQVDGGNPCQNGPGPLPKVVTTPVNLTPEALKEALEETTPPTPPGGREEFSMMDEGTTDDHATNGQAVTTGGTPTTRETASGPPGAPQETACGFASRCRSDPPADLAPTDSKTAADRIRQAYIEATGDIMPATWIPKIRQEVRNGDRAAVALVDATAIRAARTYADRKRLAWGFGTVLHYVLHRRTADKKLAAENASRAQVAEACAEQLAQIENGHAARLRREAAAASAYFATLDEAQRARWREIAARIPGPKPDLDYLAARRAWTDAGRPDAKPQAAPTDRPAAGPAPLAASHDPKPPTHSRKATP